MGLNQTNKKVFIAIPAYSHTLFALSATSLLYNVNSLGVNKIKVQVSTQMGVCYLDVVRNNLVAEFLKTDSTHMLFWDTDVAADPDAALKLINHNVDIIGGAYPYRGIESKGFPVSICVDETGAPKGDRSKGIIECNFIPTGFMLIARKVFDRIREANPDDVDSKGLYQFFKTGILFKDGKHPTDNSWYGEDVYFCRKCFELGIPIYVEPRINFSHTGILTKTANYDVYLRSGKETEEKKE